MNTSTSRVLFAVLWLASVAAAYFIGQSGTPPQLPSGEAQAGIPGTRTPEQRALSRAGRTVETISADDLDSPGGATADVSKLVARARSEFATGMNGMMNMRAMLRAMAPLAELDEAQLQQALAEVEKTVNEPQQKMMFYSLLLSQWAETDGPAALAYADEHLKGKGTFDMGARAAVIGAWARQDPDAVWRWYQKDAETNAGDPNHRMVINAVFAGMAGRDLDLALTRLSTISEEERGMALSGIAGVAGNERGRQRLLNHAETMEPQTRKQLQEIVMRTWAMTDSEAAVKWLRTRPEEDQPGLRTAAANMMMMSDPKKGADLLIEGVSDKDRPRVYDTIIGQWAYRDPRGAGEWLTKQPQGPELDSARQSFASSVAQRDPSVAMDWAKSVTNADQRASSVGRVYSMWRQKDSAAADAALEDSGLTAEKIAEVKQNAGAVRAQPTAQ